MPNGKTLLVDTSFLGDVLCAEPLVRALAEELSSAGGGEVDFLTSPSAVGILQGHPQLGEVLCFDKRGEDSGPLGLLRLARRLRARGYRRAICSHRSWRTAFLLRLAGIPERVGFDNASGAWLYSKRVKYRKDLHEVERNLQLIGGGDWVAPKMYPNRAERARAEELTPTPNFVAIAPGSIWATKRWPREYFAEVVTQLSGSESGGVVLVGGPADLGGVAAAGD